MEKLGTRLKRVMTRARVNRYRLAALEDLGWMRKSWRDAVKDSCAKEDVECKIELERVLALLKAKAASRVV